MAKVIPRLSLRESELFGTYRESHAMYDATQITQQRKTTTLQEIDACIVTIPVIAAASSSVDNAPDSVIATPTNAVSEWQTMDSAKRDLQEKIEDHQEKQAQQQQASNRQDLFARECELLQQAQRLTDGKSLFDYSLSDVKDMAAAKCSWLSSEYDLNETALTELVRLLKANLLHELVLRDKHSKKIIDLEDRLEETYLDEYEKHGKRGVRRLNATVRKSYSITQDPKNDAVMKKNSQPKKRGRIKDSEREKRPSAIELHRKEWATSRKPAIQMALDAAASPPPKLKKGAAKASLIFAKDLKKRPSPKTSNSRDDEEEDDDEEGDARDVPQSMDVEQPSLATPPPPLVSAPSSGEASDAPVLEQSDKYKTFIGVLRMMHDNIQCQENHGYYMNGVQKLVEKARTVRDTIEWPMLELCEAILDMEQCLGMETIESIELEPDEEYYCSYSGDRIANGDRVTHIRVLVRSHYRHNRWVVMKSLPDRKFEAPEFTDSIRAFFIKQPQCSLRGLVYRELDDPYKKKYSRYFDNRNKRDTKTKSRPNDPRKRTLSTEGDAAAEPIERSVKTRRIDTKQASVPRLTLCTTDNAVWCQMHEMCLQLRTENDADLAAETERVRQALDAVKATSDPSVLSSALRTIITPYCDADSDEEPHQFLNKCIYLLLNIVDTLFKAPHGSDTTDAMVDETELTIDELKRIIGTHSDEVRVSEVLRRLINLSAQFRRCTAPENRTNHFFQHSRDITEYSEFAVRPYLFLAFFNYLSPQQQ